MTMNRDHISKIKTGKWQVDYRGNVPPVLDPRPTKAVKGLLIQDRTTFKTKEILHMSLMTMSAERRVISIFR